MRYVVPPPYLPRAQGFFDEYVGACLLWMKINVMPIVPVEDMALVQVSYAGPRTPTTRVGVCTIQQ